MTGSRGCIPFSPPAFFYSAPLPSFVLPGGRIVHRSRASDNHSAHAGGVSPALAFGTMPDASALQEHNAPAHNQTQRQRYACVQDETAILRLG